MEGSPFKCNRPKLPKPDSIEGRIIFYTGLVLYNRRAVSSRAGGFCLRRLPTVVTLIALLSLFLFPACSRKRALRVGSKVFTEQLVLGEILSQHLEKSLKVPIERKFSIGDTTLTHQAFQAGEIDLYPEYTGTALVAILRLEPLTEPSVVLERCRQEYRGRMAAEWMEPFGFNNSFAMVVRAEDARAKHLATISDAAAVQEGWRLGTGFEFQTRSDGLPNLNRNYRIRWAQAPRVMGLSMLYGALENGSIDMAAGNMTDGLLNSPGTTILKDDKTTFPPYEAAVVVRQDALAAFPELRDALAKLSGRIDEKTMRRLNFEVDGKRQEPAKVAGEWLTSAGL